MRAGEAFRLAFGQIRAQKLKSFFSVVGVIIGVMFLITVVSVIEGNQLDEVEWINELQVRLLPRTTLKMNTGIGITPNATDVAPEVGVLFSF